MNLPIIVHGEAISSANDFPESFFILMIIFETSTLSIKTFLNSGAIFPYSIEQVLKSFNQF